MTTSTNPNAGQDPRPPRPANAPRNAVPVALRKGRGYTWVDADIARRYSQFPWRKRDARGYVAVQIRGRRQYLHRLIRRAKAGQWVHHRDGNPLHNWRRNLALCTPRQNAHARSKGSGTSSRYLGVWFDTERGVWRAAIVSGRTRLHLGRFASEEEAARAWDAAVRELRRRAFAKTNFPIKKRRR